jgi:hypothetical protein
VRQCRHDGDRAYNANGNAASDTVTNITTALNGLTTHSSRNTRAISRSREGCGADRTAEAVLSDRGSDLNLGAPTETPRSRFRAHIVEMLLRAIASALGTLVIQSAPVLAIAMVVGFWTGWFGLLLAEIRSPTGV